MEAFIIAAWCLIVWITSTAKNDFGYRSLNNSTFCKCLSNSENKKHRELSFSKTGYFIPVLDN